jgi:hypothetical protein
MEPNKIPVDEFLIDKKDHVVIVGCDYGTAEAIAYAMAVDRNGFVFIDDIDIKAELLEHHHQMLMDFPVPQSTERKPRKSEYDWREGRHNIRKPRR